VNERPAPLSAPKFVPPGPLTVKLSFIEMSERKESRSVRWIEARNAAFASLGFAELADPAPPEEEGPA